eukprot:XP_028349315.1 anther-specific proline-rich protein APG-like isoform X2 [Physeter catodon]
MPPSSSWHALPNIWMLKSCLAFKVNHRCPHPFSKFPPDSEPTFYHFREPGSDRDRKAPTVTNQTATCSAKGVSRPPAVHVHSSRLRTSTASARSRAPPPGSRPAPPGASRSPSPEGPPAGRRCVAQTTERPPRPVPPATRPHCPAWRFWETLGS